MQSIWDFLKKKKKNFLNQSIRTTKLIFFENMLFKYLIFFYKLIWYNLIYSGFLVYLVQSMLEAYLVIGL